MRRLSFVIAASVLIAGAAVPVLAQSSYQYTPAPYQAQPYQAQPQLGQINPYVPPNARPDRDRRRGGLHIVSAWYGIERRACDAERAVKRACEDQRVCTVMANNRLCGDPAPNVVKVLTIEWRCRGYERTSTRWEGRPLGLRCD